MKSGCLATRICLIGLLVLCWAAIANAAGSDADICAAHENLFAQISCYAQAAKDANDPAPCDRAAHDGVRYQCYAITAEHMASSKLCQKIPAKTDEHRSLIDACLSDVALKAGDAGICADIFTAGLRDSCYFKLAEQTGRSSLCQKIEDKGMKSLCTGKPVIVE